MSKKGNVRRRQVDKEREGSGDGGGRKKTEVAVACRLGRSKRKQSPA